MDNIPHFSFDEHTRNNIVSLLEPFNCSTDIFMCSKEIKDSAHLFESVEDFVIWEIENDANRTIDESLNSSSISDSNRKLLITKLKKNFHKLEKQIDEANENGIDIVARANMPCFEDEIPIEISVELALKRLGNVIDSEINSLDAKKETKNSGFGNRNPIKLKFLYRQLVRFQTETGNIATTTRNGNAAKYLINVWNPLADYLNEFIVLEEDSFFSKLHTGEVAEKIIQTWKQKSEMFAED